MTNANNDFGEGLKQFYLGAKSKKQLHPAEQRLLEPAASSSDNQETSGLPVERTADNFVRASFASYVIRQEERKDLAADGGLQFNDIWLDRDDDTTSPPVLDLRGVRLATPLHFRNCRINVAIRAHDSQFSTLRFEETGFSGFEANGLSANELHFTQGCVAGERVRLRNPQIRNSLIFDSTRFEGTETALGIYGGRVGGELLLRDNCRSVGATTVIGTEIYGNLRMTDAQLGIPENEGSNETRERLSLRVKACRIGGDLSIDGQFCAFRGVRITRTEVGGVIQATTGKFLSQLRPLVINSCVVERDILIRGQVDQDEAAETGESPSASFRPGAPVECAGGLSLWNNTVKGDLTLRHATIRGRVQLGRTRVDGTLEWRMIKADGRIELDLTSVRTGTLRIDADSWLIPTRISRDNFLYDGLVDLPFECDHIFWKAWLEKRPIPRPADNATALEGYDETNEFRPQPYEQLASILAKMGHENEARKIHIEKRKKLARYVRSRRSSHSDLTTRVFDLLSAFWDRSIGWSIDYGYSPGKAVIILAAVIIAGSGVFFTASLFGIIAPTHPLIFQRAYPTSVEALDAEPETIRELRRKCAQNWVLHTREKECSHFLPSEYSEFQPFWYSMDIAIPLVNLRQQEDWAPRVGKCQDGRWDCLGYAVRIWEWFEILAGWFLSLLFVSAVGGIIRRD